MGSTRSKTSNLSASCTARGNYYCESGALDIDRTLMWLRVKEFTHAGVPGQRSGAEVHTETELASQVASELLDRQPLPVRDGPKGRSDFQSQHLIQFWSAPSHCFAERGNKEKPHAAFVQAGAVERAPTQQVHADQES